MSTNIWMNLSSFIRSWQNVISLKFHTVMYLGLISITNAVPSLQCISWFKESKHTHSSSLANITNVVPSLQCISWFKESKHTHSSSFANITNVVPSLQCISWFKESKHTHEKQFCQHYQCYRPRFAVTPCVISTLPMLYLPFNVYLDSKRVSIS